MGVWVLPCIPENGLELPLSSKSFGRACVLWWYSLTMKYIKKSKTATKICNEYMQESLRCMFHITIFLGLLGMSLSGDTLRVITRFCPSANGWISVDVFSVFPCFSLFFTC